MQRIVFLVFAGILISMGLLFTIACGGGGDNQEMQGTAEEQTAQSGQEAQMQQAEGDTQVFTLHPVGNQMLYQETEITAKAGTTIKVVFENTATDSAMHHNFVLLQQDADIQQVGMASLQAGPDNDYIPESDAIIAHTPMSAPGETVEVTFTVPPPGDYPYICTYPGHWATMRGTLHSTE